MQLFRDIAKARLLGVDSLPLLDSVIEIARLLVAHREEIASVKALRGAFILDLLHGPLQLGRGLIEGALAHVAAAPLDEALEPELRIAARFLEG